MAPTVSSAVHADDAIGTGAFFRNLEAEFGRDHHAVAYRLECLADQHLVFIGTVEFGRVEERDAELDGAAEGSDRFMLGLAAIGEAHAHAAEADGEDFEFSTKFAGFHGASPCCDEREIALGFTFDNWLSFARAVL
jgi:hypothetical protein